MAKIGLFKLTRQMNTMILYKYVSFESAKKIIESSSLGFSCSEDLNDPFESSAIRFQSVKYTKENRSLRSAVRDRLSRNNGILSLTRQPLNPLMWAHYGVSHTGVVIGIDIEKAKLTDESNSVIPAQYGEIIYTQTVPYTELPEPDVLEYGGIGHEFKSFNTHNYELYKQAFLYKSIEWGYEEEVRVVKNIKSKPHISRYDSGEFENESGKWTQVIIEGRPLYCLKIPSDSITEVFLGISTSKNVSRKGYSHQEYVNIVDSWKGQNIKVRNCKIINNSWCIESYQHVLVRDC